LGHPVCTYYYLFSIAPTYRLIFESCADILSCDRIPQNVTIEPLLPYTNVDIFREKGAKFFSKKVWEPLY
jgi:hypothetical protein